ncbi:MAG: dephospho-CoA kinase [Acidobacteriota bacterium]|nr:dephospho-CoA kinase [Acidobacteriota bacterium]
MLKLGLTGGLASGKSFIAAELERLGCMIIRADQLGHEALLRTGPAYAATVGHFGPSILTPAGEIDRRALAHIVFHSPASLAILNSFVHPAVFRREAELIAQAPPSSIVVVEAAILIESGSFRNMDRIALALCTPEQQIERALTRPGAIREDVLARLSTQLPLSEKIPYAHFLIDTSGAPAETLRQTRRLFDTLNKENRSCDSARSSSP